MDTVLFSEKMKLAALIQANHNLLLMLPRFGIALGFGDRSVAEVCARNNIPADFFTLICNVYSFDHYIPDRQKIKSTDMHFLLPYLRASHRFYLNERLPHIEKHLNRIADSAEKYGHALKKFFDGYKNEVAEHFAYEETTVFPYIEALTGSEPQGLDSAFRIQTFEQSHNDVEEKLNDLIQLIFKYLPDNRSQKDSIGVAFDVFQLSADLNKHALIEDKVLVPYVKSLEKEVWKAEKQC